MEKISLTKILLIIAIIVIAVMGFFMYKFYNKNTDLNSKVSNLENTINTLKNEKTETEETEQQITDLNKDNSNSNYQENNSYIKNFTETVSKELGKGNDIYVDIANNKQLSINNNGEAYIDTKILAKNVVNAWYFEQGQDKGSECILFLKKDGTVTYMLYYWDEANSSLKLNTNEKILKNAENIVDAVKISGNDFEGIGGLGFLLIKADGTCIPYFHLEN